MIEAKRLKATNVRNVWLIDPRAFDVVKDSIDVTGVKAVTLKCCR